MPDSMPEEIGRRVRSWRERRGLTQADFAALVGVRPETVSSWERGATVPQGRNLAALRNTIGQMAAISAFEQQAVLEAALRDEGEIARAERREILERIDVLEVLVRRLEERLGD